jgi:peptidoglycan LD-endopeptidase LytH
MTLPELSWAVIFQMARVNSMRSRTVLAGGGLMLLSACAPTLIPLEPRPPLLELPRAGSAPAATATSASASDRAYFTESPLMVPVVGLTPRAVRDDFNAPRSGGRTHRAFDLMAPRGTPVIAAAAGQILALRQNNLGGITIYLLDESQRYVHYYAHLDRYARGLREGMRVPQGQLIGYVGHTGNASPNAPHLHFQVLRMEAGRRDWWNAAAVDVREFMVLPGRAAADD